LCNCTLFNTLDKKGNESCAKATSTPTALEQHIKNLGSNIKTAEELEDLTRLLRKTTLEAMLEGELEEHLGYPKHAPKGHHSGDSRNGFSSKTLKGEHGEMAIDIPRDRNGEFEPQVIPKHQTRLPLFNDKILTLYSRGMSTRDIVATLHELYDVEVSPTLISRVTDHVLEQVQEWQSRPLDAIYPIVYLDCIVVKIRQDKRVINKAIYLALGINLEGHKELLGLWIRDLRKDTHLKKHTPPVVWYGGIRYAKRVFLSGIK